MAIDDNRRDQIETREAKEANHDKEIKQILQVIEGINYGSVTVIIQEGKITQIERSEKVRIK